MRCACLSALTCVHVVQVAHSSTCCTGLSLDDEFFQRLAMIGMRCDIQYMWMLQATVHCSVALPVDYRLLCLHHDSRLQAFGALWAHCRFQSGWQLPSRVSMSSKHQQAMITLQTAVPWFRFSGCRNPLNQLVPAWHQSMFMPLFLNSFLFH